jgi:molybdopterin synthase sulfur carrier subunit
MAKMIVITIKLFAAYQDAYQVSELIREFPPQTPVIAVFEQLLAEKPELNCWREVTRFGVNYQFVTPDTLVNDGDEVVFIPPVSGG